MLIIDRFEEGCVVAEQDGEICKIPAELVDASCAEGDVIEEKDGRFFQNREKTEQRREEMRRRLKRLGL